MYITTDIILIQPVRDPYHRRKKQRLITEDLYKAIMWSLNSMLHTRELLLTLSKTLAEANREYYQ